MPPVRADTEFADMRAAAYDALDEETRASIEGLRVFHSIVYSRHVLGFDFNEDEQSKLKGAVHPLVRTIPSSGRRALYLASHAGIAPGRSTTRPTAASCGAPRRSTCRCRLRLRASAWRSVQREPYDPVDRARR